MAPPASNVAPVATPVPVPTSTPIPTRVLDTAHLHIPVSPLMVSAHMEWGWNAERESLREVVAEFTIHNDVGDWSGDFGYHLILLRNTISGTNFQFGLEAHDNGREKGFIFGRWSVRQPEKTESPGLKVEALEMKRSYDWGAGDYRVRIAPDGLEGDGEWFSFWVTDLERGETTRLGSFKFPLQDGDAFMAPHASATIELYGKGPSRPVDIPEWHVSVRRPWGDGVPATWGSTSYPFGDPVNVLPSSDVRYDRQEERVHLKVGGTTERKNAPERTSIEWP